jgi:T5SS/PEP-CTERM-associated repeat protein
LTVDGGSVLSSHHTYLGYDPDVTGEIAVTGGGSAWNAHGIYAGYSGNGVLNIGGGALVTGNSAYLGYDSGSTGTGTVDGTDSLLNVDGALYVGYAGSGSLKVTGRGRVLSFWGHIGHEAESAGSVTIDGPGSLWNIGSTLHIGEFGTGALNITNGGSINVDGNTYVANHAGSAGSINFGADGGALTTRSLWAPAAQLTGTGAIYANGLVSDVDLTFDSSHGLVQALRISEQANQNITIKLDLVSKTADLGVGNQGSAALTIQDSINVVSRNGYLGYAAGASGAAMLSGSGSQWTIYDDLCVGYFGDGTIEITDGATLSAPDDSSGDAYVGYNPGSSGYVMIDGPGSKWNSHHMLYIGHAGQGTLTITNGGTVHCDSSSHVDSGNGFTSSATVSGAGSTWSTEGVMYVNGVLAVTDGGVVSNDNHAYIGDNEDSVGVVTVTGSGSRWINHSNLYVGNSGDGTLLITNRGAVSSVLGAIGSRSKSNGKVVVDGIGATWTNSSDLQVGGSGQGLLRIVNGGNVSNSAGQIQGQSHVLVDGVGSAWTNSGALLVGYSWSHEGTLYVAGGGAVTAQSVSLENENCLLSIAVDCGSSLTVNHGAGAITNEGVVRILAGAALNAGDIYTPISAGAWTGGGATQSLGGTWNDATREFTVSEVATGNVGDTLAIDLAFMQRVLINDANTGWTVGASFHAIDGVEASDSERTMPSPTGLNITVFAIDGEALCDLEDLLGPGESVLGAFDFTVNGVYAEGDAAYLSFDVGPNQAHDHLSIWRYDGANWESHDVMDLTYDGTYASFTANGFSGYAVSASAIPEPTTLALLLVASLCLLFRQSGRKYNG